MLPLPRIAKLRLLILAGIILTVSIGGYYLTGNSLGKSPLLPPDSEVANQNVAVKISSNTDLVQKIKYLKCGDEEVFTTKPTEVLIGLSHEQLQNVYSGWVIDNFNDREAVMSLTVDNYCREHANNMFVGIKDGYVTVFYGKPGIKPIVKEITKIAVDKLPSQDLEELKQGMVIDTKEDLLRTLEGMQSR